MNHKKYRLILLAGAGMEICWLHVWVVFLLFALHGRNWPASLTIAVFGFAAFSAAICQRENRRGIGFLLLRIILFTSGFFMVLVQLGEPAFGFRNSFRFFENLIRTGNPNQWFLFISQLALTFLIWKRGVALFTHPLTPKKAFTRFDLGLAAFFTLLIIKLLLFVRGLIVPYPQTIGFFLSFFLFSLLLLGSIHDSQQGRKVFIQRFQKIGIILSFAMVALFVGAGLMVPLYSGLTTGAEILSNGLKQAAAPLLPVLKAILHFLLMHDLQITEKGSRPNPEDLNTSGGLAATEPFSEVVSEGVKWLPSVILIIMLLLLIAFFVWIFRKAFTSKTDTTADVEPGYRRFLTWLGNLRLILLVFRQRMVQFLFGPHRGAELYAALTTWGRHGGLSRKPVETPGEYGFRLVAAFPMLNKEIGLIIELFHRERYGEIVLSPNEIILGRKALKELRRIIHLPLRIKTWVFANGAHLESRI